MVASKGFDHLRKTIPVLLALSVASACGVDDRTIRVGSALTDALELHARGFCLRFQECGNPGLTRNYGTFDECVTRQLLYDTWLTKLPGTAWDADAYNDCAQANARVSCDTFLYDNVPQCVKPGTRLTGESCNSNTQCASLFCKNIGYNCGTCTDALSEGDSCDQNYGCGNDLTCESDSVCRTPAARNEACSDTQSCQTSLVCSQGKCIPRIVEEGLSCNVDNNVLCNFTEKGMSCASGGTQANTCFKITGKAQGESCQYASFCSGLGVCSTDTLTCTAGPSDSGSCSAADGRYCEWPALCISGSCQLPTSVARCGS